MPLPAADAIRPRARRPHRPTTAVRKAPSVTSGDVAAPGAGGEAQGEAGDGQAGGEGSPRYRTSSARTISWSFIASVSASR